MDLMADEAGRRLAILLLFTKDIYFLKASPPPRVYQMR